MSRSPLFLYVSTTRPLDEGFMTDDYAILQRWNLAVGQLFGQLESTDFPRFLIEAINQLVPVEAVLLTLEQREQSPRLLYDLGIPAAQRKLHVDTYLSGAYLLDPFCLAVSESLAAGFYHLAEIAPDDFYHSDYYRTYYREASLVDDAYFLVEPRDGTRLSLAIGRQGSHAPFSADELQRLRAMDPVVQGAMLRYWKQVVEPQPPHEAQEPGMRSQVEAAFHNFGRSLLTERERQVVHLLLRGHSSKSAAQRLEISPDTVQMHRKNLYAKLDLSSQSELFSLFIAALSHASGSGDDDPLATYMNLRG